MVRADNSLLIDIHYKEVELAERWDTRRVDRLCSLINVTWRELASMMMFDHKEMEAARKAGKFPGPVCILMTLIENYALSDIVPDPIDEPMVFIRNGHKKDT